MIIIIKLSFVEIALQYLTPYISTWESEVKCETFAMTVVLTFKLNWNYKLQTGGKKILDVRGWGIVSYTTVAVSF